MSKLEPCYSTVYEFAARENEDFCVRIAAERGFDAKQYAFRLLGTTEIVEREPTGEATTELRWFGNAVQSAANLKLKKRVKVGKRNRWSDWEDV